MKLMVMLSILAASCCHVFADPRLVAYIMYAAGDMSARTASSFSYDEHDGMYNIADWVSPAPRPSQEMLDAVPGEAVAAAYAPAFNMVQRDDGYFVLVPEGQRIDPGTGPIRRPPAPAPAPIPDVKPAEQQQYENEFFQLVQQLLVATGDPRKDLENTPKLGFPDLQVLIETVQSVDPMEAIMASLKLLTLDAALKRYDMMWWDNAMYHTIPDE